MIPGQMDIYDMLGGPNIMQIIAFTGHKGSGKGAASEAAANSIIEHVPNAHIEFVAFSDRLKLYVGRLLGYEGTDKEIIAAIDEIKDMNTLDCFECVGEDRRFIFEITLRQILQNAGNEAREMFGLDFWVNQVFPLPVLGDGWGRGGDAYVGALEMVYPGVTHLLVTDLRYPNEAERVIAYGGKVVEVTRPGVESDGHPSEQVLPRNLIDTVIVNDGTIDKLRESVEKYLLTPTKEAI